MKGNRAIEREFPIISTNFHKNSGRASDRERCLYEKMERERSFSSGLFRQFTQLVVQIAQISENFPSASGSELKENGARAVAS